MAAFDPTALERFRLFVESVRDRTDLVQLLEEDGHKLERTGTGARCLSPFRSEKDPSFYIYPDGRFYDFGTQEHGDCFTYVSRRDDCNFKDAVTTLAAHAGLVPYWINGTDHDDEYRSVIARLLQSRVVFEQLAEAAAYMHKSLPTDIRKLLRSQWGIVDETIDKLLIGYGDCTLIDHFVEDLDYDEVECLRTGLFIARRKRHPDEKIRPIDFFQGRIVFPYWVGGSVRYMIGRQTKYTPESDYEKAKYKKLQVHNDKHPWVSEWIDNDVFYGEDYCRRKCPHIVIAEGITDTIAAHQHGFPAYSAVTNQPKTSQMPRCSSLSACAEAAYIANDPDGPGEAGALKIATALYKDRRDVRIVDLPRGGAEKIDLCVFLRDRGGNAFSDLLDKAKRLPEFILDRVPQNLSGSELEARLEPVLRVGGACGPIERDDFINRVAKRFGISKKAIGQKLTELKVEAPEPETRPQVQGADLHPEAEPSTTANTPDVTAATGTNDASPPESKRKKKPRLASGESVVRGEIHEDVTVYYTVTSKGEETLSSFVLTPTQRIVVDDKEHVQCNIEWPGGTINNFRFPPGAWVSRTEFVKALPVIDLVWTGSDDHVQGLRRIVSEAKVPVRVGTSTLGFQQTGAGGIWVTPHGVIDKDGFQAEPAILYVKPRGDTFADNIAYTLHPREETIELAKKVFHELILLNEARVIVPTLGWFFATAFKSRLVKTLKHFPLLMVHGTPGSGKTTLLKNIFWPLFGIRRDVNAFSCRGTYAPLMILLSSTTDTPVVLDELKQSDMKRQGRWDQFLQIMRRMYDGESEERGHRDMSVTRYDLSAPVAVAGETTPDDEALLERMLLVCPSKNALTIERREAYEHLQQLPFERLAGPYAQWTLTQDEAAVQTMLRRAHDIVRRNIAVPMQPRVRDNLVVMTFGLVAFDAWCTELGIDLKGPDLGAIYRALLDELAGGEEGSAGQVVDIVDRFLAFLSTCARNGALESGKHYAHINKELCLHLPSCYAIYLAERRRLGLDDETNGERALRRRFLEKMKEGNSYIVRMDQRIALGRGAEDAVQDEASRPRCVVVNYDLIKPSLGIERFPGPNRTWGGASRFKPN